MGFNSGFKGLKINSRNTLRNLRFVILISVSGATAQLGLRPPRGWGF